MGCGHPFKRDGAFTSSVFIGLGGNLASPKYGPPRAVLPAALQKLQAAKVEIVRRSRWYLSAPVPPSDQALYLNGVAEAQTSLSPHELLDLLHEVEAHFGRVRTKRDAARVLDLDLLAYRDLVMAEPDGLELPHPRMHLRAFVLKPLAEIAPDWRHPVFGLTISEMIEALPLDQWAEPAETA